MVPVVDTLEGAERLLLLPESEMDQTDCEGLALLFKLGAEFGGSTVITRCRIGERERNPRS